MVPLSPEQRELLVQLGLSAVGAVLPLPATVVAILTQIGKNLPDAAEAVRTILAKGGWTDQMVEEVTKDLETFHPTFDRGES